MKKATFVLVPLMLLALIVAPSVYAKIRTGGGGDMPFYARIERGYVLHTDEWAAVIFYRPPECVPDDFDLLDFYDFEAFACAPPTTDGFSIWAGEPWVSGPIQLKLHGLGAVPVWFVAWPELEASIVDDSLTMLELELMQSLLIGSARFYSEALHPTGVARVGMINCVAFGMLEDGRSFEVHATSVDASINKADIRIASQ